METSDTLVRGVIDVIRAQLVAEQKKTAAPGPVARRLLTVPQAAEYLARTESAVRQLIFKKVLPVVRFDRAVRIDIRDLDKMIDDARV